MLKTVVAFVDSTPITDNIVGFLSKNFLMTTKMDQAALVGEDVSAVRGSVLAAMLLDGPHPLDQHHNLKVAIVDIPDIQN